MGCVATIIGLLATLTCPVARPSGTEAARLLEKSLARLTVYYVPPDPRRSTVAPLRGAPWTWPAPRPTLRLDGTLTSSRPIVYSVRLPRRGGL